MSLPRYPAYRDSGVAWIGSVPAHWSVTRLKFLLAGMGSGGTPDTDQASYWSEDESGTAWVAIGDLSDRSHVGTTAKRLTDSGLLSKRLTVWPAGTLLFSMYASLGHTALLLLPAATNQAILALLPAVGVDKNFIRRWLEYLKPRLGEQASSNTQDNLNAEKVRNLVALRPSINEQAAIAAFLDRETAKIDGLIAEQEKLIALLAEKRQATISHAVTRGLNPQAPMKDSGVPWLGEVPAHWDVKQLRHFAEVLRGKFTHRPRNDPAFYDGDHPFVQTGDITGASRYIQSYRQTLNELGASVSKEFPSGTLVMAIAANIGDVAILRFPAYFPDSIVGLVPKLGVDLPFLYYLMTAMKAPMMQTATVSTQLNLNVDQISALVAGCPPVSEQAHIAAFLDAELERLEMLRTEAERGIELLKERRAALIAAAVTGQIDVRGFVPRNDAPKEAAA